MNLVIVESPAKGRTIKNILGEDFKILASFGHVRDLPKKELGIDIKNHFKPTYIISSKARKVIATLKSEIAKADALYLATDYDREGEAIAWHIIQAVDLGKLKPKLKASRVTFHEITKPAVLEAIKHPREIDMNLVDAQQARRILDRLVGYKLSPFLWHKVAQGLSAGRVQSVAVRLVVEKEKEIRKFIPQEYWQIEALLKKRGGKHRPFKAILIEVSEKKIAFRQGKLTIKNSKEAQKILDDLKKAEFIVKDVKTEPKIRWPAPPFTTSTLQQEASRKLNFSPSKTMRLAQGLYEDGLITYMRTDSVQVSPLALAQAKKVIAQNFGHSYVPPKARIYKTRTLGAQEAHEAIRPTNLAKKAESLAEDERSRLYDLIWKKMIASQMRQAEFEETNVAITADKFTFRATGSVLKFDGFLKVYTDDQKQAPSLPPLEPKEKLDLENLEKKQYFTEPPQRFSEATLIRELEKRGIGRPSTYAPTISTIQERGYVEKVQGKLVPKEIGEIVNDLLVKHFPEIVDYQFTSKMEEDLDKIAEEKLSWQKVISEFYDPFSKKISLKSQEVSKKEITEEEYDENCPKCGQLLKIKLGRYGKFLACSGFPKCKYTKPLLEKLAMHPQEISQEKCPKCGKDLSVKEGKFGPFLACVGFPKCKFTKNLKVVAKVSCPSCGGKILRKNTRKGKTFWGCENYPSCKTAFWDEPQEKKCPKCKGVLTFNPQTKLLKCSQCQYVENST